MEFILSENYRDWIKEIKSRVRSAQIKAALAVNAELIRFYWELGRMIAEKQNAAQWGDKLIESVSKELLEEFPDIRGLSTRNLKYCRQFYLFYTATQIGQQLVAQLGDSSKITENQSNVMGQQLVAQMPVSFLERVPWGHNILIFTKANNTVEAIFYLQQTIENNWSRDTLALQIKSNLYARAGKPVTNFKTTLPEPIADLAQQTLKDPYVFDFMTMAQPYKEKDIEDQLINNITKFMLELGKGFAFVGRQYLVPVGKTDYYIDLLFYHTRLKCYVVIELKNTKFIPEYAGKLNFYLSSVDSIVKQADDHPTIGILLCRDKNNIEAEFALRDINKPMGVSEFPLLENIPDNLKNSLPTVEELELDLSKKLNENNIMP